MRQSFSARTRHWRLVAPVLAATATLGLVGSVTALANDGAAAARVGFNSPSDANDGPELGREQAGPAVKARLEAAVRATGRAARAQAVDQVDVLHVTRLGALQVKTVGFASASGALCWTNFATGTPDSGDVACTAREHIRNISASRQRLPGTATDVISGWAPAGTVTVRLESASGTADVRVTRGGSGWAGSTWYTAAWPADVDTTVTALGENGRVIATVRSARAT